MADRSVKYVKRQDSAGGWSAKRMAVAIYKKEELTAKALQDFLDLLAAAAIPSTANVRLFWRLDGTVTLEAEAYEDTTESFRVCIVED